MYNAVGRIDSDVICELIFVTDNYFQYLGLEIVGTRKTRSGSSGYGVENEKQNQQISRSRHACQ